MTTRTWVRLVIALVATTGLGLASAQRQEIALWYHGGSTAGSQLYRDYIAEFNAMQDQYTVVMTEIPGGGVAGSGYNDAVNAAAVAGDLPCILDLDGPNMYNYAWAGFLTPLDPFVSAEMKADFLPSLIDQGTYRGKLYALGQYDSGLGLVGRRSLLEKVGARIPTSYDDPWTLAEFEDVLAKLSKLPDVSYALDTKMNYGAGEWFTYAFSPVVESFGGDLIDRTTYATAEGFLNGPAAVEAMTWIQSLFTRGYSTLTPPDDNEFINGKAAMGWFGHWMAPKYIEAWGDDLVVLPMPIFGGRAVTGMGSWAWSITSSCSNKDAAWAFVDYMLRADNILRIVKTSGVVPGRISAFEKSDLYAPGGTLHVLAQQLQNGVGVPRPKTPAYPTITSAFWTAMDNIDKGGDVQDELDAAVDKIDQDLREHDGYQ